MTEYKFYITYQDPKCGKIIETSQTVKAYSSCGAINKAMKAFKKQHSFSNTILRILASPKKNSKLEYFDRMNMFAKGVMLNDRKSTKNL